jgi:hypothetical protein
MNITLEGIVFGLVAMGIGVAFAFWGLRLFLVLLPIWGFVMGFLFGANVVTALFGEGFLATTTSWVVGFVVALIFAVLSYLYYWFAVVFLGASAGYALGIGIMTWLNAGDGLLAFIVGFVFAVAVALAFIVLRIPKFLVVAFTAFGGAFAAMAGLAVLLGRVPINDLQGGTVGAYVRDELSWIWVGAAILLGIGGFFYQWMASSGAEMVDYDEYRNPGFPAEKTPMRPM